jgi:tetratricopeptide (TPR) repeat protein
MSFAVPVGPFTVHAMIGVGGAGEVWSGVHTEQGIPVAVKVITAARAKDARYQAAFYSEVRAVAGLDHPGIVRVFDTGIVSAEAESQSFGRLVAGSPYLAMALAGGGALRGAPLPERWSELRAMLSWLLDALAHAHARGVIHRDLKPGNILLFDAPEVVGDRTGASRLRITDFGLAHLQDRGERPSRGTSGTPVFMAPEQFRGVWRDFGPWTDLYALGGVAWSLATGAPPFQARGVAALMHAHLDEPLPTLVPRIPVPEGFEHWVRRLLAKEPQDRYQRAADAAWALFALGESNLTPPPTERRYLPPAAGAGTVEQTFPDFGRAARRATRAVDEAGLAARRLPPLPPRWDEAFQTPAPMALVGAGLGLYGLRTIPLVGRSSERDALWAALHQAVRSGEAQLVALTGPAGVGKSRLAEWVATRAEELGGAVSWSVTHGAGAAQADGLRRLVTRVLGVGGLPRGEAGRRVDEWLDRRGVTDELEHELVLELLWPADEDLRTTPRIGSANERYAVLQRLLTIAAGQDDDGRPRPVVLWLDDAQWSRDALGFASWLMARGQLGPWLLVLTARDEALEDLPAAAAALDALAGGARSTRCAVGPLPQTDRVSLVGGLLHLRGDLASEVQARTGGNPLFAVQLVGDWVARGVLVVGARGFVLRPGAAATLPDGIHGLWADRIARLLDGRPDGARLALEIAAVLGVEVDLQEWRSACLVAGLPVFPDLVPALLDRRLARPRDGGWSFAHGMLRESLERASRESGRIAACHHAVAASLEIRWQVGREPGLAARLARHLVDAGRPEDADEPLASAAAEQRAMSDYTGALELVERRVALLERTGAPDSDLRWGEVRAAQAALLVGAGRLSEAERVALDLAAEGERHGWGAMVSAGLRHAASVAAKRGQLQRAEAHLRGAERAAAEVDELELARDLVFLCDVVRLQGRTEEAHQLGRRALARFDALDDRRGRADALASLAAVTRQAGDDARTEAYCRLAIPAYTEIGSRFGVALVRNTLAEVLRGRGEWAEAEVEYLAASEILSHIGSPEVFVPQLNLGLLRDQRGDVVGARAAYAAVLDALERAGRRGFVGVVHALLLPGCAVLEEWRRWDTHAAAAAASLAASGIVDGDVAAAAERAARLAWRAGERVRAREVGALAVGQWVALQREDRAAEIREELGLSAEA